MLLRLPRWMFRVSALCALMAVIAAPVVAQNDTAFPFSTNTPRPEVTAEPTSRVPALNTDFSRNTSGYDPSVCAAFTDGSELSADCAAMIEQFPRPLVEQIRLDSYTIDNYSFWRVGPDATATFDSPGGGVNGEIPAGFNFVRAVNLSNENWLQIEGGSWVERARATYAQPSFFRGVTFTDDTVTPFAWVLDLSRIPVSRFPGGERDNSTGRYLERYETVNVYSVALDEDGWRWYMIGPNQWVEQRFVAKVQPISQPESIEGDGKWIAVDLYEQTLVAYEGNTPVFATLVSSGLPNFETNEGTFNVWARIPNDGMSGATGAPEAYAIQSVPWVMYFDGGISLHGSYWHNLFGYRQSHGCVNLTISDARWLFEWTGQDPEDADRNIPTPVFVYSSGEYGVTASGL